MRKLILRITLPLLLLIVAPLAYAQDEERPEFKMPCQEVLKLGLDKFIEVYGEKTQDYSSAGQKAAFAYYVDCKRPANDALAASLSEERRKQVEATREELNKFGGALWNLRYFEAGGGTMWGLIASGAYAERENFMEAFVKTLTMPGKKSPRARRNVKASLARIQRWLSNSDRKAFTEYSEPDEIAERKKLYQETIKETQDALAKLSDILQTLPDAAARHLATQMASEAKNALANSP